MKEYILLLGADQFLRERSLAGTKAISNLPVWTANINGKTKFNRYFDNCIEADSQDSEKLLKAIQAYEEKGWTPKVVIPLNDWTLKSANEVNEKMELRHLKAETVHLARNKFAMKQAFEENNVNSAPFSLIETKNQLLSAVEEIGLPVVIKPYDFGGSAGVYLARTEEEAIQSFKESQKVLEQYGKVFGVKGDKYLVEKYIDSQDEVSVEVLCYNNEYKVLTVTEKYLSPEPWFSEMGHLVPSHRVENQEMKDLACEACRALNIEFGLAHVEIKIKGNEMWVIEAAARPGGDGIMDQIERAYGINPYSLHVSTYLNENPFVHLDTLKPFQTAAIAFLKAEAGEIKEIITPKSLNSTIHSLDIQASIGDISEDPTFCLSREGTVEYTWPHFLEEKTYEPIELTKELSKRIFKVEEI